MSQHDRLVVEASQVSPLESIGHGRLFIPFDPDYKGTQGENMARVARSVARSLLFRDAAKQLVVTTCPTPEAGWTPLAPLAVRYEGMTLPLIGDAESIRAGGTVIHAADGTPLGIEYRLPSDWVAVNNLIQAIDPQRPLDPGKSLQLVAKTMLEELHRILAEEVMDGRVAGLRFLLRTVRGFDPDHPDLGGLARYEIGVPECVCTRMGWTPGQTWVAAWREPVIGPFSALPLRVTLVPNLLRHEGSGLIHPLTLAEDWQGDCDGDLAAVAMKPVPEAIACDLWQGRGIAIEALPARRPWAPHWANASGRDLHAGIAPVESATTAEVLGGRMVNRAIGRATTAEWTQVLLAIHLSPDPIAARQRVEAIQGVDLGAMEGVFDSWKTSDGEPFPVEAFLQAAMGNGSTDPDTGEFVPAAFPHAALERLGVDAAPLEELIEETRMTFGVRTLRQALREVSAIADEFLGHRRDPDLPRILEATAHHPRRGLARLIHDTMSARFRQGAWVNEHSAPMADDRSSTNSDTPKGDDNGR